MTDSTLPIYLLAGMTPEYPVYAKLLPLLPNAEVVPFVKPEPNESLKSHARRMASQFSQSCFIGGVSFGGILATGSPVTECTAVRLLPSSEISTSLGCNQSP
ncbi:MAG: hypothetical protein AAF497_22175, partial [Planctomycetota bacterium]